MIQELAAAGQSRDDRGEPTWAALGRHARETRLLHLKNTLYDPAALDKHRAMLGDHQLWPLFELAARPRGTREQVAKQLAAIKLTELTARCRPAMTIMARLGNEFYSKYHSLAMTHGDRLYYDRYLQLRSMDRNLNYSSVARQLHDVSPFAPLARALLIRDDWGFAKPLAAAWEAEARHPEVFSALARQSLAQGRHADAERLAAEAVRLAPQSESYTMLAEARLVTGGEAKYIATMDEFLKTPDTGEGHARARADVVDFYLERKQVDKAQPYAEAAATEFRRSWARECLARVAEGRGDWETAEKVIEGLDATCNDCRYLLYYWRLRTGRGDLATPRAAAERHLKSIGKPQEQEDIMLAGVLESAAGRPAAAADYYIRLSANGLIYFSRLVAIAEHDATGDVKKRDTAFQSPVGGPTSEFNGFVQSRFLQSSKGVPTGKEIDAELKKYPAKDARIYCYVVGRLLQTRGQKDLAAVYFRRASDHLPSSKNLFAILATLALREMEPKTGGGAAAAVRQQEKEK